MRFFLLFFIAVILPAYPAFADDEVEVEVEVKEIDPETEEPLSEELPPVGIPEEGAPSKYTPKGPFDWISQHPLTLTVLQLPAESAYVLPRGAVRVGYRIDLANVFLVHESGTGLVHLDMENLRQTLSYRRGMTENIELGVFVPIQYSSRGFMDGIIESWHGFFGLPTGDRPVYARNDYTFVVASGNDFKILGESDSFGVGDISITGKYFIRPESARSPAVSARAGIKLPTGSASDQIGSGGFDIGFDVLVEKSIGAWILYGQAGYIITGGNDFGLEGNDLFEWSLAGEYQASRKQSWIVQFHHVTNPYHTGVDIIDADTLELALGWKRVVGRHLTWSGGFSEDVLVDSAPDFAIFSEFVYEF